MISGGFETRGINRVSSHTHPVISIITVVFNGAETLEKTIKSVIEQSYDNIEYIIVDGNSADDTLPIIQRYDEKIALWQSEPDKGIYDAMNKGLSLANGDFVLFLGADDLLFNCDVIESLVTKINNFDSVYYGDVYFNSSRVVYDYKFSDIKICYKNICHQAIFYPKCIYKNKNYKIEYKMYADWVYNLEVFSNYHFQYIPLTISRFNNLGSSVAGDVTFQKDKKRIICDNFGSWHFFKFCILKPFLKFFYALQHILMYYSCR